MSCIKKPMLAETLPEGRDPCFPLLATPKLDGIRALIVNGVLVSRQFKPIPNEKLRKALQNYLPEGADGEILYGNTFQDSTSAVMTKLANTYTERFKYYWFDYAGPDQINSSYESRIQYIKDIFPVQKIVTYEDITIEIIPWFPIKITNKDELSTFEKKCVNEGFEGVIVRKCDGKYKFGRSTLKEELMLKIKRFNDSEAIIIGCQECLHNENEAVKDALGYKKRSSHAANKTSSGKLGAFIVKDLVSDIEFNIGTGFTDEQRKEIWKNKDSFTNKILKYKYFDKGVKDAPRHPVFLGFRSIEDM